jgi:potassium voltage-gated channel Shal-related subfamily D member 2
MYLSFRRSQHALFALGFFVLMVVIVFSTLLYVRTLLDMLP